MVESRRSLQEIKQFEEQERQQETHGIYRIGWFLAFPGSILAVFSDGTTFREQQMKALVLCFVFLLTLGLLEWSKRRATPEVREDVFLLLNSSILLVMLYLFRGRGILPGLVVSPTLFFILFSSRSKKRIVLFNGLLLAATLFYALYRREAAVIFTRATYIGLLTSLFILGHILLRMLRIYERQEERILQDFATMKELQKQDRRITDKLHRILDSTEDWILDYDLSTKTVTLSEQTRSKLKVLGIELVTPETVFKGRISEEDQALFLRCWEDVAGGLVGDVACVISFLAPLSAMRHARLHLLGYRSRFEQSDHVVVVLKDMTAEKEQANRLHHLAYYDPTTRLLNREGFRKELAEHQGKEEGSWYVVLLDVIGFHHVNVYGYSFGDALLREIASVLCQSELEPVVLGRMDVDVLGLVLTGKVRTEDLVSKLQELGIPFEHQGVSFTVHFRCGVSKKESKTITATEWIRESDMALSQAKTKSKASVHLYDTKLDASINRRHKMLHALERALRNQEIYVVYQPKFATQSNQVLGYEALARWASPEFGQVPPLEFIGLAEQSKLIVEVERHIISLVCTFLQQLPKEKRNLEISINISSQHLLIPSFVEDFCGLIASFGVETREIGVELTETALIQDFDQAIRHLEQLRERGFRIYLDDFGTGYSSLSYLNRLPIDVLKIDRSFVMHIGKEQGKKSQRLLDLMLNFSKVLQLSSVAEGVEDESQVALLKDLGCDAMQGFYFSKPLGEKEVLKLLQASS